MYVSCVEKGVHKKVPKNVYECAAIIVFINSAHRCRFVALTAKWWWWWRQRALSAPPIRGVHTHTYACTRSSLIATASILQSTNNTLFAFICTGVPRPINVRCLANIYIVGSLEPYKKSRNPNALCRQIKIQ